MGFPAPRKLERGDRREDFGSGADDLDLWFAQFAWENQQAGNAVTYVVADDDGLMLGYYSITMASVGRLTVPERLQKGRPNQVPCVLLARLAVRRDRQGSGLGRRLLADALRRAAFQSDAIGAAAVLVHCRDEAAKAFYLANADFLESPADPLHLLLPMKDLKRVLQSAP
ncbi:MAG: GNAT family N-acetyltransferase [Propionibacteriaceae bacterium]|jgi:GNAT superfamily N-acetyltransferase|nr:GNAT family N-acetyltransferase [Propionibacteriaceae bacterium]